MGDQLRTLAETKAAYSLGAYPEGSDVEVLIEALEVAEAEAKVLVAMLAAAKDVARREGYVPVADYESRERAWRGYEVQIKSERDEALAKLARVEALARQDLKCPCCTGYSAILEALALTDEEAS